MLDIDFSKYSLVLFKDSKIVLSSTESGLRPLIECVKKYKGEIKDCTLYDKVIGLAAAKLVVYSKVVSLVITQTCSRLAKEFLEENNIGLKAENIVDNILTEDRSAICPMELKAMSIDGVEDFFLEIEDLF